MPDYTSILRRSISALPDSSPEVREAVYQRARAALARQLTAVDPPLTTREIERQHHELEEAVARLEAELTPPAVEAPEAPAQPRPEPPPSREIPVAPARAMASDTPAAQGRSLTSEMTAASARAPAPRAEPVGPARDSLDENDADRDVDDDEEYEDEYEEEERGSRVPLMAGLVALVVLIGGAAAYGFAQREALMGFLGMSESEQVATTEAPDAAEPPAAAPEPQPEPAADDISKRPDRLTNGDDPPADPAAEAETALLNPVSPDAPPPAEALPPAAPPADAPPVTAPPPAALDPAQPPGTPPPREQTASLEQPGESIVAQRAIYYFQGAEGSPGQATDGTVAWAQITKDNAPAVQATLQLAERDVSATVTISRNTDSTLPASHLVEIQFTGEFGPSPIQRVPALVLKQTEQARGEPLNGAAVPVTDQLFWIALADNEEQIARNLQLLREGSWFDIPILFNDGTRALLTFEKGIPGDRVFETVMSVWTPS